MVQVRFRLANNPNYAFAVLINKLEAKLLQNSKRRVVKKGF